MRTIVLSFFLASAAWVFPGKLPAQGTADAGHSGALAPGAHVTQRIPLDSAQAIEVTLTQPDAVLQLSVREADGSAWPLLQNDAGRGARLRLTLVAGAGGSAWDLDIVAKGAVPAGYRLVLGTPHVATVVDHARVRQARALAVAEGMRRAAGSIEHGDGTTAEPAAIRAAYDEAFAAASAAHDDCGRLMAKASRARYEFATGDYAAAQRSAQAALGWRCGDDAPAMAEEAVARRTLGSALGYLGDIAGAIREQERALALYRKTGDRSFQAMAQANLSANYRATGATQKALDAAQAALQLAEQAGDRKRAVFTRESIAAIHLQRGEFGAALAAYRETLDALRTTPYPMVEGMSWNDLGLLYRNLGEEDESLRAFDRAEAVWTAAGDQSGLAETLLNRGDTAFDAGRVEEARAIFQRSVDFDREHGFQREEAHALAGLGRCAIARGDWDEAKAKLLASLDLARRGGIAVHEAAAHLALGDLASLRTDLPKAANEYRAAEEIALRAHDDSTRVSALGSRARLALDAGDATAARGFVMPAIDLIESERARIDEPQLRTGYFASQRAYYELAIEVLMQLHAQFPIAGHDVEALEMAERARARALRDELATRAAPSTDAPPAVIAAERVAADALRTAAWQSAQVAPTDAATSRRLQVEVDAASRRLDEARGKLRAADPRYAALLHPQPFRLSEARRAWLGDAVVFEYWLGAKRSYLWRIARDDVRIWTLPSRERIEAEVDALRTALLPGDLTTMSFVQRVEAERRADAVLGAQARSLFAELLPPGSAAPESVDIAIVADGELQRTPFALFFARPLVYLPSLAVLRELRASGPRRGRDAIAIFADPIFGADDPRIAASKPQAAAPGQPAWRRLAHAGDEVAALAAAFPDVPQQVATGAAASRAAALDMSWSDYRIVHFATHAAIDLRHPELSGVVLSLYDAQGNPQDGMLRMSDVYDLHMPVDLVVLGVCDATRERGRGAEGMFGLSRAFFHAGARRLLVSLWSVDDAASSLLFASFYRHLAVAGTSPQEALQRAQTDMQAEPRWRSPFYWAGFVVHGDWR